MVPSTLDKHRESQKKTGTDDRNITDSFLASCLSLSCAQHSPTITSDEMANATHGVVSSGLDLARQDSNSKASNLNFKISHINPCQKWLYVSFMGPTRG